MSVADFEQAKATTPQAPASVDFETLCELEPLLKHLQKRAHNLHADAGARFCRIAAWYGYRSWRAPRKWRDRESFARGFKAEVCALVGWLRREKHPILSTPEAYRVAYFGIFNSLPECRKYKCRPPCG